MRKELIVNPHPQQLTYREIHFKTRDQSFEILFSLAEFSELFQFGPSTKQNSTHIYSFQNSVKFVQISAIRTKIQNFGRNSIVMLIFVVSL